jgi:hypothetical protein
LLPPTTRRATVEVDDPASTPVALSSDSELCYGQSASLSWNRTPIWNLTPDFYYCYTVAGLLMWSVLSDEGTGLSFTIAAGPRQGSHSRVQVPWDLRLYLTVSDSRLPFSSPPTTRRVTVEVFDPTCKLLYVLLLREDRIEITAPKGSSSVFVFLRSRYHDYTFIQNQLPRKLVFSQPLPSNNRLF